MYDETSQISSPDDADAFLNKFLTGAEKDLVLRRAAVIKLLEDGKKYREIKEILKISKATISNTKDILSGRNYGINPGRKRQYSKSKNFEKKKRKKLFPNYKGAESII